MDLALDWLKQFLIKDILHIYFLNFCSKSEIFEDKIPKIPH